MKLFDKSVWYTFAIVSLLLLYLSISKVIPVTIVETMGFISGALCVLLVVKQNIWNFPIGIANNIVFIILFLSSRLFGDMVLQIIYIGLAITGWWQWVYGGQNRTELKVSHITIVESIVLCLIGVLAILLLHKYFIKVGDAAPLLDATTTVLSLIAQYLLNSKRIENWYIWIITDVIYIILYIQKSLYLTSVLYALFIIMCVAGLVMWRRSLNSCNTRCLLNEAV